MFSSAATRGLFAASTVDAGVVLAGGEVRVDGREHVEHYDQAAGDLAAFTRSNRRDDRDERDDEHRPSACRRLAVDLTDSGEEHRRRPCASGAEAGEWRRSVLRQLRPGMGEIEDGHPKEKGPGFPGPHRVERIESD